MISERLEKIILTTSITAFTTLALASSLYLSTIFYTRYKANEAHIQAINIRSSSCYSQEECQLNQEKARQFSEKGKSLDNLYRKLIFKK